MKIIKTKDEMWGAREEGGYEHDLAKALGFDKEYKQLWLSGQGNVLNPNNKYGMNLFNRLVRQKGITPEQISQAEKSLKMLAMRREQQAANMPPAWS